LKEKPKSNNIPKEINNNLLSWFDDELDKYHKERQEKLKDEQDNYINQKTDNYTEQEFKKMRLALENAVEGISQVDANGHFPRHNRTRRRCKSNHISIVPTATFVCNILLHVGSVESPPADEPAGQRTRNSV
jgi:hypothetical protein